MSRRPEQCPLCYGELEVRLCAPCDECGSDVPTELEHMQAGRHTYTTYSIYQGLRLTLCGFCTVDFGSHVPEYFGFRQGERLQFDSFEYVARLDQPTAVLDKVCPSCNQRLKFLRFAQAMRSLNP